MPKFSVFCPRNFKNSKFCRIRLIRESAIGDERHLGDERIPNRFETTESSAESRQRSSVQQIDDFQIFFKKKTLKKSENFSPHRCIYIYDICLNVVSNCSLYFTLFFFLFFMFFSVFFLIHFVKSRPPHVLEAPPPFWLRPPPTSPPTCFNALFLVFVRTVSFRGRSLLHTECLFYSLCAQGVMVTEKKFGQRKKNTSFSLFFNEKCEF